MYGVVNLAIEDLIVSEHGEQVWEDVRRAAQVDLETFVATQQYPDEVTYQLVGAIAQRLHTPAHEVLRLFGRHWIEYTARYDHGQILSFAGSSVREFLSNIDLIHAHVAASMPDLRAPTFEVEDVEEGHFIVRYRSHREGLAPLVIGLLEGIAAKFETEIEVTQQLFKSEGADHDAFAVRVPVPCS